MDELTIKEYRHSDRRTISAIAVATAVSEATINRWQRLPSTKVFAQPHSNEFVIVKVLARGKFLPKRV